MSDRFFERLRDDAPRLRYEPDDVLLTRLTARVRERVIEIFSACARGCSGLGKDFAQRREIKAESVA